MSNDFNKIEMKIAKILRQFPFIKRGAKKIYSRIMYCINFSTKTYTVKTNIEQIGPSNKSNFYGYYDKPPINNKNLILSHVTEFDTMKKPNRYNNLNIEVYNQSNLKQSIAQVSTSSFNWQQGARAMWVSDSSFIFNDYCENEKKFISKIYNVESQEIEFIYSMPVQDAFKNEYFLSINYRRLQTLRPDYGYNNMSDMDQIELEECNFDGIWRTEFDSSENNLILSLNDIIKINPHEYFKHGLHKVNHVMISPDGESFIFLHRIFISSRRFDRLLIANSDGTGLRLLSDNEMVSHCAWIDNNHIVSFMRGPNNNDGYFKINVKTAEISSLLNGKLDHFNDGHPHVRGDIMVIDTYPNKARNQKLIKVNLKSGDVVELAQFKHNFKFKGETRCDLHPRISLDGRFAYIDSVYTGRRQLYRVEI
ncbi:MAG: glycosyl transferase [Rhizobiales bacterium]|nr:hypothetical protein [Hyphomicrobiales bacterium]NRB14955.1 glycosyl transferase [Hyphomicrobiales bacterium]